MSVEILFITPDYARTIEHAARTSTATDCKENSEDFVRRLVKRGHLSVGRHCNASFEVICSRACYDKETEVYTKNGWKFFKDLTIDDLVATRNISGELEFNKPDELIRYIYSGNMHKYKSQSFDLCVTPNHNLFAKKYDIQGWPNYELIPSENIEVNRMKFTKKVYCSYSIGHSENFVTIPGFSYEKKYNKDKNYIKTIPT